MQCTMEANQLLVCEYEPSPCLSVGQSRATLAPGAGTTPPPDDGTTTLTDATTIPGMIDTEPPSPSGGKWLLVCSESANIKLSQYRTCLWR